MRIVEVICTKPCTACEGKGRVKGGRYAEEGEVIPCLLCGGKKTTTVRVPIAELARALKEAE